MKVLVIGKGKMGTLIYNDLKNKFLNDKKVIIDQISFDQERASKKEYDYIIDFSHPDSIKYYKDILNQRTKIIIGTTGFNEQQEEYLEFLSKMNPIVKDANFSKGILYLKEILLNIKDKNLKDYQLEIIEKHHESKLDKPSGTALELSKIVRTKDIKSIRDTDLTSSHTVIFKNDFEEIKIIHTVFDKQVFINGIEESIKYLHKHKNGLFSYQDVIEWN